MENAGGVAEVLCCWTARQLSRRHELYGRCSTLVWFEPWVNINGLHRQQQPTQ